MADDLVRSLLLFVRTLRATGVRVRAGGALDAVHALADIGITVKSDVRLALRAVLVYRREDQDRFDALFEQFWRARGPGAPPGSPQPIQVPRRQVSSRQPLPVADVECHRGREHHKAAEEKRHRFSFRADFPTRGSERQDQASGAWVLSCPRELEAQVFEATADPTIWPAMARMPVPVELICADPYAEDAGPPALIGRAIATELPIEYESIPDTSHFLQIERPQECIRATEAFLTRHGFLPA